MRYATERPSRKVAPERSVVRLLGTGIKIAGDVIWQSCRLGALAL